MWDESDYRLAYENSEFYKFEDMPYNYRSIAAFHVSEFCRPVMIQAYGSEGHVILIPVEEDDPKASFFIIHKQLYESMSPGVIYNLQRICKERSCKDRNLSNPKHRSGYLIALQGMEDAPIYYDDHHRLVRCKNTFFTVFQTPYESKMDFEAVADLVKLDFTEHRIPLDYDFISSRDYYFNYQKRSPYSDEWKKDYRRPEDKPVKQFLFSDFRHNLRNVVHRGYWEVKVYHSMPWRNVPSELFGDFRE